MVGQLALRDFLVRGELDRHVRRMRTLYQRRREALLDGARPVAAAGAHASGAAAGPVRASGAARRRRRARAAQSRRRRAEWAAEGLALHRFTPGGPPGLVLGFGNLSEPAIEQGVRLLAEAYAAVG